MSDAAPLGADDAEELVEVEDAEEALEAEATADGELADGEFADEDLPEPTPRELAEAARAMHLAALQRLSAEFANFRKQADRRNAEVAGRARGDLAERLLPVLDACDLAIGHGADGVEAIRSALVATLGPVGLEVLDPQDAPFDPARHEAVLHEAAGEDDDATQVVVEVLRRGYAWEGRVLRPAMVKVRG